MTSVACVACAEMASAGVGGEWCDACAPSIAVVALPWERLQGAQYTGYGRNRTLEFGGLWHFVPTVPRKAALCGLLPSFWTAEIRDSIVGDELITVDPCEACVRLAKESYQ